MPGGWYLPAGPALVFLPFFLFLFFFGREARVWALPEPGGPLCVAGAALVSVGPAGPAAAEAAADIVLLLSLLLLLLAAAAASVEALV